LDTWSSKWNFSLKKYKIFLFRVPCEIFCLKKKILYNKPVFVTVSDCLELQKSIIYPKKSKIFLFRASSENFWCFEFGTWVTIIPIYNNMKECCCYCLFIFILSITTTLCIILHIFVCKNYNNIEECCCCLFIFILLITITILYYITYFILFVKIII
jgi:hypothetical protein